MRSMSLASLLVLLQCRQRQCRQCSTNFQFFEWARERSFSEQTFFSSDVGCLFRWRWTRWTVEVASSTLSVEAAFTMSPGRGDIRDIHNVCHSRWKLPPVLQYAQRWGSWGRWGRFHRVTRERRYTRYTMYVTVCPVLSRRFIRDTSLGHQWARKLALILRAICLFVFPVM